MYRRKIVLTGKSSFVVTLPKDWIEKHGLKKKQDIYFLPLADGSLLLTSNLDKKEFKKILHIAEDSKINHLKRQFYSAYLGGYTDIIINSKSTIPSEIRSEIKEMSSNLMGIESGAETPDSMTFKSMISSEGIKFHDLITSLMEMTRTMHQNAFQALKKRDVAIAKFVLDRDKEVNPKNHAITRMMNTYLQDLTLTQSLNVSLIEAQSHFAISLFLESLADYAVLISRNIIDLIKAPKNEKYNSQIIDIGKKFVDIMENIFKNWENKNAKGMRTPLDVPNVKRANSQLDLLSELNKKCKILMQNQQKESNFSLVYAILEKIRRSIKVLSNIALISIDLVEGMLKED